MTHQYRFPLARLLALREQRERAAAASYAAARTAEAALLANVTHANAERADARDRLLPAPGCASSVAELTHVAFLVTQLDAYVANVTGQLGEAAAETARQQALLVDRVRDRRILERLRERRRLEWQLAADRRERETMDAVRPAAAREVTARDVKADDVKAHDATPGGAFTFDK
jgi:flagellar export protein FliJ